MGPHRLIDWIRRRRASGRPVRSTLVLIVLFALIGGFQPFFLYDWFQQAITARINKRPYTGDVVVVAFDKQTVDALGRPELAPADLARLVDALGTMKPRQLVIDRLPLAKDDPAGAVRLAEAFRRFTPKPAMFVTLTARDASAAAGMVSQHRAGAGSSLVAEIGDEPFWREVDLGSWISWSTPLGAPNGLPQTQVAGAASYSSLSQTLARRGTFAAPDDVIDMSLDPASIPTISVAAILAGSVDRSTIVGRRVLLSSTANTVRDTYLTPQGRYVPRAYLIVAGAETMNDGPQRDIGWVPGWIIAAGGALAWLALRRPWGRIAALVAAVVILASPVLLERGLVFQQTSTGLFLLMFVAAAHGISRIRASLALARNAVEAKSWFLAQASHDLRQPIHAIGMLSARLGQTELTPVQSGLVEMIDRSVDGASRMFQSLLDIATIESGSLKPVIGPVGVDELFSDIEGQYALLAERAGVELRFVPSDLTLLTDRSLAATMLQNVVSNAIKYATGKKVLIGCRRQGSTAALCVYDRGAGISEDDLRQVTKAFFRASRNTAGAEGAGLGLAIVHRLADLLRLRLTVRSALGRGTGVTMAGFRLVERPAGGLVPPPAAAAPSLLSGLKVLLVDDDLAALRAMEPLLDQWGCDVTAAHQFPAIQGAFDAVVTDYDFGGGQTLVRFREPLGALMERGTMVVVITGHPPEMVRAALAQDRLLVLAKPVRPAELRAALLSIKLQAGA